MAGNEEGKLTALLNRRRLLLATATGIGLSRMPGAFADDFPSRTIRFVVPFTPGAGADRTARIMADKLAPSLGQAVVVENRGGASGEIGTGFVVNSRPDGYVWLLGHDPPLIINQHLRRMSYDALHDLAPVSLLTRVPLVLAANPSLPANTVPELVKLAQTSPGRLTFSSSGSGTTAHLAAEVFKFATKTKMLHVAYKGQAEAVTDVLAGRCDFTFTAIADIASLAKAGKLKVLAIGAPNRFDGMPEVPTVAECGYPGFDVSAFHALLVPAKTPEAIVMKINRAVDAVLAAPDVDAHFKSLGLVPVGGGTQRLAELLKSESERYAQVIREANVAAN